MDNEEQIIEIPVIHLRWSDWVMWTDLLIDSRFGGGVKVPNSSGVYEVKYAASEERLTIGKANNLRMRLKQGLVKGKVPHSTGTRIREVEDVSKLVVRWALSDRPLCAEEELHRLHIAETGRLPKYTLRT